MVDARVRSPVRTMGTNTVPFASPILGLDSKKIDVVVGASISAAPHGYLSADLPLRGH